MEPQEQTPDARYQEIVRMMERSTIEHKDALLSNMFFTAATGKEAGQVLAISAAQIFSHISGMDDQSIVILRRQSDEILNPSLFVRETAEEINGMMNGVPTPAMRNAWRGELTKIFTREAAQMAMLIANMHEGIRFATNRRQKAERNKLEDEKAEFEKKEARIETARGERSWWRNLLPNRQEEHDLAKLKEGIRWKMTGIYNLEDRHKRDLAKLDVLLQQQLDAAAQRAENQRSDAFLVQELAELEERFRAFAKNLPSLDDPVLPAKEEENFTLGRERTPTLDDLRSRYSRNRERDRDRGFERGM